MFMRASGVRYVRFLKRLHIQRHFDWYMEVGCRTGRVFRGSRSKTIAVDPFFRVTENVIGVKPALHIFQQTSDDFFASRFLENMGIRLSFAFLDGMHLFEFLLRDIINTERNARPEGVIALHDCCPYREDMTTRDVDQAPQDAWTGDVWKLIPILKSYRPDLTVDVLDCEPTGLVLLSNLDPSSTVLADNYDRIVADWTDVTMGGYGFSRFCDDFTFVDAAREMKAGFPRFARVAVEEEDLDVPEYVSP